MMLRLHDASIDEMSLPCEFGSIEWGSHPSDFGFCEYRLSVASPRFSGKTIFFLFKNTRVVNFGPKTILVVKGRVDKGGNP